MNSRSLRPALVVLASVGGLVIAGVTCVSTDPASDDASLGPRIDERAREEGAKPAEASAARADEAPIKPGLYLGTSSRSACDLDAAGALRCWGSNLQRQLDQASPLSPRTKPSVLAALAPVAQVALGAGHTCALLRDGDVRCWGSDAALFGALDLGGSMRVSGLGRVTQIVSGSGYSCALNAAHDVLCWGKIPGARAATSATEPRTIAGLSATKIAASSGALCALKASGVVACFGENSGGNIVPKGPAVVEAPTDVERLESAVDVAVSDEGTCAVKADGAVACWGEKHFSWFGPSPVYGLENVTSISAGGKHFCAVISGDRVKCWGDMMASATGGSPRSYRGEIEGSFTDVHAGLDFSCARATDRSVRCWGNNDLGQLAQDFEESVSRPVAVDAFDGARAIEASKDATCALFADSKVRCVGPDARYDVADEKGQYDVTNIMRADSLLMSPGFYESDAGAMRGSYVICAFTDRLPTCWGNNRASHLPTQDAVMLDEPATLASMGAAKAYAFGGEHACSLSDEGAVTCWGGLKKTRALPTPIQGIAGAAAIALGESEGCALLGDGTAACFTLRDPARGPGGAGAQGPARFTASKVLGARGLTAIAHGRRHACGVSASGKVLCWGDGAARSARAVDGIEDAVEISLGDDFSCARRRDGTAACWGKNDRGQLADGSLSDHPEARSALDLHDVTRLRAGPAHACALTKDSKVYCWGDNRLRVVEPGSPLVSRSPKTVPLPPPGERG